MSAPRGVDITARRACSSRRGRRQLFHPVLFPERQPRRLEAPAWRRRGWWRFRMTRCCANSTSTGWSTSSKSLPTPGSFGLPGLRWQENESTENERETPCYRREHNSRHRGANAFAAGADQVADILAAFRNVDGGLGGGTVTSVAPSAKRLSVSSGRRKRRNDQPQMDRDRPV